MGPWYSLPYWRKGHLLKLAEVPKSLQLRCLNLFFFLRLPIGQYGPVSQLSRSEESCTGPFNWGEAHCAGEKVKRKIGPFQWKSLWIKPNSKTTKGRGPPRQPGTPRPGSQVHGPRNFFFASAFRPVWPGRCDLSFICIPQSTRALDQGGVEPRQAVSPKALRPWTIPLRYSVG